MLKKFLASSNGTLVAVCLGWLLCAIDIVLLILFQEEIAQSLSLDVQKIRIGIGVGLLGSAIGGIWFAQLGDQVGRVKALAISVLFYSIATGLMAFIQDINQLYLLRFLAGMGTGGEWSIGFALLAEVSAQKKRGLMGGIVAMMFNIGTFIGILFYQSDLGWRWSFGLMATPAIFSWVFRMFLPESQTWLDLEHAKQKGLLNDALKAQTQKAPIQMILKTPWLKTTLLTTLVFTIMNFGFYAFSTLFMNYLQSSENGGLHLAKEAQFPFQLILNLASLVSVFTAGFLSDLIGRRKAFALFCTLGGIGFILLISQLNAGQIALDALKLPFALCCFGFGINGIMGIYTPELYPTHLRSTGPGFCQNIGKGIGGMAGPIICGILLKKSDFATVFELIGGMMILLVFVIWLLPEVGKREIKALEETVG